MKSVTEQNTFQQLLKQVMTEYQNAKFYYNHDIFQTVIYEDKIDSPELEEIFNDWKKILNYREIAWKNIDNAFNLLKSTEEPEDNNLFNPYSFQEIILLHQRKDQELQYFDKDTCKVLWWCYDLFKENIERIKTIFVEAEELQYKLFSLNTEK